MALNFIADVKLLWVRLQPWFVSLPSVQVENAREDDVVGQEYLRRLQRCEKQLATTISWHWCLWVCFAAIAGAGCLATYLALISHSIFAELGYLSRSHHANCCTTPGTKRSWPSSRAANDSLLHKWHRAPARRVARTGRARRGVQRT